ncbi:hypothetical protein [Halomonas heilongjiangensis]|uniref:Uncharacterized protein n=1 Tax=Halomonas heilongjiangensis TaxID=1387883 RepID=A0A2N7TG01_9GAMM|nr:hypothetical protein [Halomonas heilongjiangensis]PMR67111.1 hypothetical protein C1H66_20750 [Halomonas heilongjiangensis]PXX87848.1 hypothetical protein CR158_16010 [Halomonas heilongjiangensis]
MSVKRCVFTFRSTEVELLLTRDPDTREWLATMNWYLDESPEPKVHPMAPLAATLDEDAAWGCALDWASLKIDEAWLSVIGAHVHV